MIVGHFVNVSFFTRSSDPFFDIQLLGDVGHPRARQIVFRDIRGVLSSFFDDPLSILSLTILLIVGLTSYRFAASYISAIIGIFFCLYFFFPRQCVVALSDEYLIYQCGFPEVSGL